MFFLFTIISFHFSCGSDGPGTLGGLDVYTINSTSDYVTIKLDEFVAMENHHIPVEYKKYDNWNEKGYDFLTHWTIYYVENDEPIMYWISLNATESLPKISIRSIFKFNSRQWILAKNVSSEDEEKYDATFEKQIESQLGVGYKISEENE